MPGLFERDAEREALADALLAAARGQGSAVLVEGAPGIGKSRLLDEAAASARRVGLQALRARAHELEQQVPYAVVRDLFGAELKDAAAWVLGTGETPENAAGVVHALYELAGRVPRALLVDDAQWADAASVRFLLFLSRRVEPLPLALIIGARMGSEFSARLVDAGPVRTLRPQALSANGVGAILHQRLGRDPTEALRDACRTATGGTPLLVVELARVLTGDDDADLTRLGTLAPQAVTRSVALRLAAMTGAARALARATAVLGDEARLADAAALAGLDPSAAASAAGELTAAALLADAVPLTWRHPLLRVAALAGVAAAERTALHLRAARILDARGADVALVAAQLLATEPTAEEWAVAILRRAAADARRRGAPDVATQLLRHALTPAVTLELARAEIAAGERSGTQRLRELYERDRDPNLALELAYALMAAHEHRDAAALLRGAQAPPDHDLALQILATLAVCERYSRTSGEAEARLAATTAGLTGETAGERYALAVDALNRPQATAAALAAAGRLAQRAGPDGLFPRAALGGAAVNLVNAYALDEAEAWLRTALADWRARGLPAAAVQLEVILGSCLRLKGDLEEAERHLQSAAASELGYAVTARAELALVRLERGAPAEVDPPGLIPEGMLDNVRLLARARHAEAAGRDDEALADLLELGRRLLALGLDRPVPPWRSLAARLLNARDRAEAQRLAAEELAAARRWGGNEVLGIALRGTALVADPVDRTALEASVAALEAGQAQLELARSLVELGAARRRAREPSAAREPLERGLELAQACGAVPLAQRARTELLATGARPRGPVRSALTPSERRVAELACAGRTNRHIAAELFVSVGTVETHLRHVFQKLGVRSRAELAQKLTVEP